MTAAALFDRYVFVDWSAKSVPAQGQDSIWIAEGDAVSQQPSNPRTRLEATRHVSDILRAAAGAGHRVLVGFDFPYGYPHGLAAALDLPGSRPAWRRTWDELAAIVRDSPTNENNRFAAAADLNERLGAEPGPFWGCPPRQSRPQLASSRGAFPYPVGSGQTLSEYRLTEQRLRGRGQNLSSAWKLFAQPTVGSQALVGIPRVRQLRDDPALLPVSRVWPFETGFAVTPPPPGTPFVLHAEIWPGVIDLDPSLHPVRDAAQVLGLVRWAAALDQAGALASTFSPAGLSATEAEACLAEEGWILGA